LIRASSYVGRNVGRGTNVVDLRYQTDESPVVRGPNALSLIWIDSTGHAAERLSGAT